jgi:hypothetical protein
MLRAKMTAALALAASGVAMPVLAADTANHGLGVSVGITGGTNGLGLEAGYRFTNYLGIRANSGNYTYNKSFDSNDFNIDGKAKLKSIGGLVDVYPFGGSFRVSVGMRSNKNQFGGVASPNGTTVEVGDDTYPSAAVGDLTGSAKFKKNAPTATIGWGGNFKTGLHFGFEVGVVAQGSPNLSATSSGALANDPTFKQSLADQLSKWEDDSKDYKLWPVVQLNLVYRF